MDCKYYLPCGMCELTKEKCIQYGTNYVPYPITINPNPITWRPDNNIPVTLYGPPHFTPSDVNWEDFTNEHHTSIDEIQ